MFAFKFKIRYVLLALIVFWYVAPPRVSFYFSEEGIGPSRYILNTQHSIDRGEVDPGDAVGGIGHIFPDDRFFMELYWDNPKGQHCVSVVPKWPTTNIYIGADGALDESRTDMNRLVKCYGE